MIQMNKTTKENKEQRTRINKTIDNITIRDDNEKISIVKDQQQTNKQNRIIATIIPKSQSTTIIHTLSMLLHPSMTGPHCPRDFFMKSYRLNLQRASHIRSFPSGTSEGNCSIKNYWFDFSSMMFLAFFNQE